MPELFRIQTAHYEFTVWASDISKRQQAHQQTLDKRGICANQQPAIVHFSPTLLITEASVLESLVVQTAEHLNCLTLDRALFFENMQYQFEWIFLDEVTHAELGHRLKSVNDSFRFAKARGRMPARLTGTINTQNDVGWMRLPLRYQRAGIKLECSFSFEVLPTKMDLHSDLPAMYKTIDQIYPLWRFSLAEKTEQGVAKSKQRDPFPLFWLAHFNTLRKKLEQGLKIISQSPHSRLQPQVSHVRADRLKGRLSPRLVTRVKQDLVSGIFDKRYRVEKKHLSVDTPENRFIKMVVTQCKKQLGKFETQLRKNNRAPDKQRISDAFLAELASWQLPLQHIQNQSFFKELGPFNGLASESLVLQQKTGYSAVYQVWQELKFYLDVLGNQSSVSMKSVAEIYEVWCFLMVRRILIDELGFIEKVSKKKSLKLKDFFEYQLKDGFTGAFEFERSDGVKIRLAHEPPFKKYADKVRTYLVSQQPDILLEVTFPKPSDKSFIWLFDAKYRIKTENNRFDHDDIDVLDHVPDDAINQMHRYRDALIKVTEGLHSTNSNKSRPVFGAFALYPGYFDQENEVNPYHHAIKEIGIGAFALLPSMAGEKQNINGHFWLLNFLREQIGDKPNLKVHYSSNTLEERLYVQEAARIPYYGMKQMLYQDLTMTIALGHSEGRAPEYYDGFINDSASHYHMPEATFKLKFKDHVLKEICYLALVIKDGQDAVISKVWPVRSVKRMKRNLLKIDQTGKQSKSDEVYFIFELGNPLKLKFEVRSIPQNSFRASMKLTTLNLLEKTKIFSELESVYDEALV
ncbi:restriction endonuclease-like protein [Shewanella sp. ALD9]|uniref:restriction endonuclease-like protein n=1 Tax=Shewanella sp. ALD9 TaxID=2058330 RepID=UPI000C31CBF9|nr:restriction endonuclease-like protein [Shewanella sp. ALD9]PKH28367.1 hypothetical protein CXF88_19970 [Shewanella sp. ALD9]